MKLPPPPCALLVVRSQTGYSILRSHTYNLDLGLLQLVTFWGGEGAQLLMAYDICEQFEWLPWKVQL